ncbi:dihydroorotase [Desulfoluna limicola]|uniref:Dihydroorotase n=1 Tax=Desulfoluna limicola TaxID=2810562 RepID=A0ABM7PBW2_9BACT|nr:dihydroorotase [Desulfoluna limicola]BCS94648.1 dihydroorotase [Desulfoluna limicola]
MLTVIKDGKVVDPGNVVGHYDIWIQDGVIGEVVPSGEKQVPDGAEVIDAKGLLVVPGLIDLHVHLREPGEEYKETIETGTRAAAAGGFTAVCAMPNTKPVNDSPEITAFIVKKAKEAGYAKVYPAAAITGGLSGGSLCEYGELKEAGAVAITDDGRPVEDGQIMRRAMEYAKGFGMMVMSHCEELSLVAGGCMNEGLTATRMGLPGIPNISESLMVIRDIGLAELTGAHLHVAHVSTTESIDAIRDAKKRGVSVSAETAPHYFTLTDEAVKGYNTNAKMNPPLRTEKDRQSVREALADGTLDAIATDHAPHSILEKDLEFNRAMNGIIGLETSLPLSLKLVEDGVLSLEQLVERMSKTPARILGLNNSLAPRNPADITLIDEKDEWTVVASELQTKSANTPFDGWTMKGRAVRTIVDGKTVYEAGDRP